jgi:hypothetical protein
VAYGFVLFHHGFVVLRVGAVEGVFASSRIVVFATFIHEELG